jgi:NTE family protein
VLAHGWTQGGAEGARAALDAYWQRVSRAAASSPLQRSPLDRLMGRWTLDTSPAYVAMDLMARVLSPYDLNPFGLNPLRAILPFPDSCTAAKQLLNSFVGPCSAISMHVEEPRHG